MRVEIWEEKNMAKTIVFGNQKGGVAKTTSTYNVAMQLALKGYRVLMVDSDPQASLTIITGLTPEDYLDNNLCTLLDDIEGEVDIHKCIISFDLSAYASVGDSVGSLGIIPTDIAMANGDLDYVSRPGNDRLLKSVLETVDDEYDFICIDSLPSLGIISINNIASADYIIGCVEPGYQALRGIGYYKQVIERLIKGHRYKAEFLGVVITKIAHNNDCKDICEVIRNDYSVLGEIPLSVEVSKGEFDGVPISIRKSSHLASLEYSNVADYIIKKAKGE
jgi:chromosome partitioning protein